MGPAGARPDAALWAALRATGIADRIIAASGLGAPIGGAAAGGVTLSTGEPQLLCLARLLAAHPRVGVLDEAWASIDWETDVAVKRVLQTTLAGTTLISISHWLGSVADADQGVVLGGGRVKEVGTPAELRGRRGGAYAALVAASEQEGGGSRKVGRNDLS